MTRVVQSLIGQFREELKEVKVDLIASSFCFLIPPLSGWHSILYLPCHHFESQSISLARELNSQFRFGWLIQRSHKAGMQEGMIQRSWETFVVARWSFNRWEKSSQETAAPSLSHFVNLFNKLSVETNQVLCCPQTYSCYSTSPVLAASPNVTKRHFALLLLSPLIWGKN